MFLKIKFTVFVLILFPFYLSAQVSKGSKSLGLDLIFFGYTQQYENGPLQFQLSNNVSFDYFPLDNLSVGVISSIDAVNKSIDWRIGPYGRYFLWQGIYLQPTYLYGLTTGDHWAGGDIGYSKLWKSRFAVEPGITYFKVFARKVDFDRWGIKLGFKYYFIKSKA